MVDYVFFCFSDNPEFVKQSIGSISWKSPEDQIVSFSITKDGILISTEDSLTIEGTVFLKSNMFVRYELKERESYDFQINITPLVDALNIDFIKVASGLEIRAFQNRDLQLQIIAPNCKTVCTFRSLDHSFSISSSGENDRIKSPEVVSFSMDSKIALAVLNIPKEFNLKSCSLKMIVDPFSKEFIVITESAYGTARSTLSLNQHKGNLREKFVAEYPAISLIPVIKALTFSMKTQFIFNENKMLSIQQAISSHLSGDIETAVEFILQPSLEIV